MIDSSRAPATNRLSTTCRLLAPALLLALLPACGGLMAASTERWCAQPAPVADVQGSLRRVDLPHLAPSWTPRWTPR